MKKLVIILPVLVSLLVSAGFAVAETQGRLNPSVFLLGNPSGDSEYGSFTFAIAADDGGALGEKAKCRAMLRGQDEDQSDNSPIVDQSLVQKTPAARLALGASLAVIREDEV